MVFSDSGYPIEEITADVELVKFDTVTAVSVYKNSFDLLQPATELAWRVDDKLSEMIGIKAEVLKLSEIVKQLPNKIITVVIQEPLGGEIWQYGNYGKSWYKIGKISGYA